MYYIRDDIMKIFMHCRKKDLKDLRKWSSHNKNIRCKNYKLFKIFLHSSVKFQLAPEYLSAYYFFIIVII